MTINYQFMEFPDRPDLTTIRTTGRAIELDSPLRMCGFVAVSIAIFAWKLGRQNQPIVLRMRALAKDQAKVCEDALRFYRFEAPFEIDWSLGGVEIDWSKK